MAPAETRQRENPVIILASGSMARQDLLRRAGVEFMVVVSDIDEDSLKEAANRAGTTRPDQLAAELAAAKAVSVSELQPRAIVIGADQILAQGTRCYSKPADTETARAQLTSLRSASHHLYSAVCCAQNGAVTWHYLAQAQLHMRSFSDAFLEQYLKTRGDDLFTSVGAYKIEGPGIQLFDRIDGDFFSILGLPLLPLLDYLRKSGVIDD